MVCLYFTKETKSGIYTCRTRISENGILHGLALFHQNRYNSVLFLNGTIMKGRIWLNDNHGKMQTFCTMHEDLKIHNNNKQKKRKEKKRKGVELNVSQNF